MKSLCSIPLAVVVSLLVGISAPSVRAGVVDTNGGLWSHDNLVAWCVSPWDAKKRGPEELAQMLSRLGFKHFAYISPAAATADDYIAQLDAHIEALTRHGIELTAVYQVWDADDPISERTFEAFKRYQVHPQLWVTLAPKNLPLPSTQDEWRELVPDAPPMPAKLDSAALTDAQRAVVLKAMNLLRDRDVAKTPSEQQQRVAGETDRIQALVNLARRYGLKVELYNHNGWFGMMENQLAIIDALKERGITDLGIVYNFAHARDTVHDDSKDFPSLWRKIQPHVVAVNVTGLQWEDHYVYPSAGDSELAMMKTIQESGWKGRVGLIAEKGGDAEVTLANYIRGLDWLAAELKQPGSGGPAPFTPGRTVFQTHCVVCHDNPRSGAPSSALLHFSQTTRSIYSALTSGPMRAQGQALSDSERRQVAEYLTGRPLDSSPGRPLKRCVSSRDWFDYHQQPVGTGWGIDAENTRLIPQAQAGLSARDLEHLELKWAFAFPDAFRVAAQPVIAGGGLFFGSQDGTVYALDARSGCVHWTFKASAEIMDGAVIHVDGAKHPDDAVGARARLFFGDRYGVVYALDATTGSLQWKKKMDPHPATDIMGTPVWWDDRLYVPVDSLEEAMVGLQGSSCCVFRGSLVALKPSTGEVIWKRYTIPSPAVERVKDAKGLGQWGPAGAGLWRSPTIDPKRGSIYFTTGNGYSGPPDENTDAIFAVDLATGRLKWRVQTLTGDIWPCVKDSKRVLDPAGNCAGLKGEGLDADLSTAPILVHKRDHDDILVAGRKDGTVFGVDPSNGRILWKTRISSSPDPYSGNLYWGLAVQDGEIFVPSLGTTSPNPNAFVPSPDDGLYALDAFTGRLLWKAPVTNDCDRSSPCAGLGSAPIGIPRVIFAGAMDGIVRAYDAANGKVLWRFDTAREFTSLNGDLAKGGAVARNSIMVANGMVYIGSGYPVKPGNVLLAFSIKDH